MSGRILIVDDIPASRMTLKTKLEQAYYDVLTAGSGQEAVTCAISEQPDMILLDVSLSDMSGYAACGLLKSQLETEHIPVIMLTGEEPSEQRILGVDFGADDFLSKPIEDQALFARLRNLMRMKIMFDELRLRDATSRELGLNNFIVPSETGARPASTVLMIGDDTASAREWLSTLRENLNIKPCLVTSEKEALSLSASIEPELFIVHNRFQEHDGGLRLISALRSNPRTRQSAFVFIADDGDIQSAATALDLGATDYVMAPVDSNELVARVRAQIKRKRTTDRLRSNVIDGLKMAVIDPLTGLYNRRYATQHIQNMIARSGQNDAKESVAVMMLDLDNFKQVNDAHGHDAGDHVLREFALRLQENVRGVDLVARLGGEEFCVAMPDTGLETAAMAAERVRTAIGQTPFRLPETGEEIAVTVSVGVAVSSETTLTVDEALKRADLALFASKHKGRNRVSFFKEAA